jgi:hypothetical protein
VNGGSRGVENKKGTHKLSKNSTESSGSIFSGAGPGPQMLVGLVNRMWRTCAASDVWVK